jgi:hypothetical protein
MTRSNVRVDDYSPAELRAALMVSFTAGSRTSEKNGAGR